MLGKARGPLEGGLILIGVVGAVAALPVVFLWIFLPDEPAAFSETTVEPPAPLPPRVEEVTFTRGVTPLDGVLHVPPQRGPHPAVAVVGTPGPAASHLGDFGKALARAGIVGLTLPGGGDGESGESTRATERLTDHALAGLDFLRAQPDVRWTRMGILDLSDDGSVALRVAARADDLAFMVLVGSGAVPEGGRAAGSELAAVEVPALWLFGGGELECRSRGDGLHRRATGVGKTIRVSCDHGCRST